MSGTLAELQLLLRERLRRSHELTPSTELVADLALDSIEQLDLIVELENHFEIALELGEDEEIQTVGQLVAWIDRARGAEAPRG
jgi:acyl carrier protein